MNEEFSFMNEKIKDKPFYKKKWVQIIAGTIGLAVLFGLVSGAVFMKIYNWVESKQEQEAIQDIEIPEDAEEAVQPETVVPEQSQTTPETIMVENEITLEDYGVLFAQLRGLAKDVRKSIVMVTALSSDVDWFNEAYESRGQSTGMIIGDNGVELLILTKYSEIEHCDGMQVTFVDDTVVAAALKKYDVTTGLAVISVNLSDISEETNGKIKKATLGNSVRLEAGTPVLAIGRADGSEDSMKVGTLTSVNNRQSVVDAEYTILSTDMMKIAGADGVLVNLKGEVIGIIQEQHLSEKTQNVLSAYAISDIKSLLEHLSNNQDVTYLGIKGISVTTEAESSGVPSGVYVTEVEMDSPAMRGGIQNGDVIQAINGQRVTSMAELSGVLQRLSNKQNISLEGQRLTKDGYKKVNYQTSLSVLE
ncbi:MAG: trypsin-like peptidase domain-containing protein [Lachnospiraceae bacterium]|nr:trypsin-like peptidase domain-containing protein [Lachnospiraceae bacterium]